MHGLDPVKKKSEIEEQSSEGYESEENTWLPEDVELNIIVED